MALVTFDVPYSEPRNRLTNAFRWILAIPHLMFVAVWGYAAELVAVVQWFIILFTGQRNSGIWQFQRSWFGYSARVTSYTYHLFDQYPAFGTDPGNVPVHVELRDEEPADRLTNGLRFIWVIPALIIGFGIGIAVARRAVHHVVGDPLHRQAPARDVRLHREGRALHPAAQRLRLLMTDTYPKWGTGAPTGSGSGSGGYVPPPPTTGPAVPPPPPPGGSMPPPPPPRP